MNSNSIRFYALGLFALFTGVVGVLLLFQAASTPSSKQVSGVVTSTGRTLCVPNEQRGCGTCNTCSTPGSCISKCAADGKSWLCVSGSSCR